MAYSMEKLHHSEDVPKIMSLQLLNEITNNFSEERKLGSGMYGNVYKGEKNGEEIAVKMLHLTPVLDDFEQFKREFENLRRLRHQNIVRLLGYCYETKYECVVLGNGKTVLVENIHRALCFEYMHNGSLQKHLDDEYHGLDWQTRYKIIKGTCEGLKYLHEGLENPIYHLDLKPDNILLDKNMVPKLADFGLSRLVSGEQTHSTRSSLGTIGYLPPEYIEENLVSIKLDIFSLGVVMIRIMTGYEGYHKKAEMSSLPFIDLVHENWRNRLQTTPGYTSLEAECRQVKRCIEIALDCVQADRNKRPKIGDIIHWLNETENMNMSAVPSPLQRIISVPKGPGEASIEIRQGFSEISKLLDIHPLELHFPWEPNKSIDCPVTLTNRTDRYAGVSITPTCPQTHWDIRFPLTDEDPSSSVFQRMGPHSTWVVVMTLEGQQQPPPQDTCKFEVLMIVMGSKKDLKNLGAPYGVNLNMDSDSLKRVEELGGEVHRAMLKAVIRHPASCQEAIHNQKAIPRLHGRDNIRKKITEDILLNRNGGNNCAVICVKSESGLGKTALLHVLYNDQQLLDAFETRIWIQMSYKFDRETLFRKTIEFVTHVHCEINNLSFLEEMVKEVLADRKFLLFLDDADIEDEHFWTTVLEVLSACSKDSVIVIATRSDTVAALTGGAMHSYCLDFLSEENNLTLLQQYTCEGNDIKSNPELMTLAEKFIARFGANPLNLRALGGLLCHTDTILLEQEKLEENRLPCLQLCHDVLPKHLKNCLAFCSLFPKGYIFDKHHTVLLWLSRGFVVPIEGQEPEDVGVEYFNELLCRSFFQYSPSHDYKDEKFVMHELIYNVVVSVSCDKYFRAEDLLSSIPENICHLSFVGSQFQNVQLMSKTEELKDLQTFLVVQPEWQQYKTSFVGLDNFFLKFTSLEILDLSHTDMEELPGSIVGLRNLQYLSLNNTSIRTLPSELCSLNNLQTLEAKDCRFLTVLPGETKKLLKLRHLNVTKELGYVRIPHGIGQLTELQTLPVFHASAESSYCSISELGNLHGLRGCLQLAGLESVKTCSKAQDASLKVKQHLRELTLQWHDDGFDTDVHDEEVENVAEQVLESLQPHANLQELAIRGYEGGAFPAWIQGSSSLPSLVSLTLDSCYNCTQFPALAQLPSLKFLSVRKMYEVQRLSGDVQGSTKFPSLELLNLWEMYGLEELFEISEGDCPRLRKVCISRCPELKRLPCTPSVAELILHCCHQLPDIPELASLVSLKIEGFHSVKSFNLPRSLPVLKKLEIRSCSELSLVHGLSALTTIQRLKIAGCPNLVSRRINSPTT